MGDTTTKIIIKVVMNTTFIKVNKQLLLLCNVKNTEIKLHN